MVFYIKVSKSKKTLRKPQTKQKSSSLNVQAIKAYPLDWPLREELFFSASLTRSYIYGDLYKKQHKAQCRNTFRPIFSEVFFQRMRSR